MNQQEFAETARRYREQMEQMYGQSGQTVPPRPTPPPPEFPMPTPPPQSSPMPLPEDQAPIVVPDATDEQPMPENGEHYYGTLRLNVTTARGARPVADATLMVYRTVGDAQHLIAVQVTDSSGYVPALQVEAPPPTPDQRHPTAYYYDIEVYAPGYYREHSSNIPVFPNIISMQTFDLIPLPLGTPDAQMNEGVRFYNPMQQY